MSTSEVFLIAMMIIFTVPYLIWRVGRTEYFAPSSSCRSSPASCSGPECSARVFPNYYHFVFNRPVISQLNGIA